jgi:selenide,water dikinase
LFDPQTAGGLLAGVPQDQVGACINELQILGYTDSKVIGSIASPEDVDAPINVKIQVKFVRPNIMSQRIYI